MDARLTLEAAEAMVAEQRRKAEQEQRLDRDGPTRRGRRFNREIARGSRFVAKAAQR